jgi:hypothetical protein
MSWSAGKSPRSRARGQPASLEVPPHANNRSPNSDRYIAQKINKGLPELPPTLRASHFPRHSALPFITSYYNSSTNPIPAN